MPTHELGLPQELLNCTLILSDPPVTTTDLLELFVLASDSTPNTHVCFALLEAVVRLVCGVRRKDRLNFGLLPLLGVSTSS